MAYAPLNNCLDCKHFRFVPYDAGYSEYTSGNDMRIYCAKDHWDSLSCYSELDFRNCMQLAKTCKQYEPKS
jgi:hypothetical protein